MRTLKIRMKSGQILILVLLIVVVTLAVGLSIASRNITNLRTSTQTEQSQRAFTAAEGGVEDVLAKLSKIKTDITGATIGASGCAISGLQANCNVPVGDLQAKVNVLARNEFEIPLVTGDVGQIDLTGTPGYNGNVYIEWAKRGTEEAISPAPSVEITFVCSSRPCLGDSSATWTSSYGQKRFAYYIDSRPDEQGFSVCPGSSADYLCRVTISTGGTNVLFARIRPYWKKATVKVTGDAGFPVQIYEINSQATTNVGIARKVQVKRTALPVLPAAFDFALYSKDPIVK